MLFKLSNLNSNLALTLGYLNPALNNSALGSKVANTGAGVTVIWESPRFGHPHSQNPSDMGIPCNPNPKPNPNRQGNMRRGYPYQ